MDGKWGMNMELQIGDLVERLSYGRDIVFRILEIKSEDMIIMVGEELRLIVDAPLEDVVLVEDESRSVYIADSKQKENDAYQLFLQDYDLNREKQAYQATGGYRSKIDYFQIPGRVLHVDGDPIYLKKCMDLYKKLGVPVQGYHCKESDLPQRVPELIEYMKPDILVLTGHDAYVNAKGAVLDVGSYRNSKYFVDAVQNARKKQPHLDQLVIFAGACQSHFEAIIHAGANYASSPTRVNIHALDPVYVVGKISLTSFMDRINVWDVVRNTLTGEKGIGGVETKGLLRIGLPYQPFDT